MDNIDKKFSDLLRNVNRNNKESAKKLYETLEKEHMQELAALEDQTALNLAFNEIQDLKEKIDRYEVMLDEKLDDFIEEITETVKGYDRAIIAVEQYDKAWFQGLVFSDSGKVRIAQAIKENAAKYNGKNPLWDKLSTGDLGVLQ